MMACGLFGVLTVVGSGLAGSPLAGLAATVVAVASWRYRPRIGFGAALVGAAALLYGDPWLAHPLSAGILARLALPLLCAAIGGALYRWTTTARGGRGLVTNDGRGRPVHAGAQQRATIEGDAQRRRDDRSDEALELDVVQRLIRDLRTTLGVDEVLLWRSRLSGELYLFASSAGSVATTHLRTTPSIESLLAWATEQGMVAGSSDADGALFLAAPFGARDAAHGVLGIYCRDRQRLDREHIKSDLIRYAERTAALLELLADGRSTERYRARLGSLLRAAERIQNASDLGGLGDIVCRVAIEATGTSHAAFVLWDDPESVGKVVTTSPGHPVLAGASITAESLVGTACRERQRFSIDAAQRMSPDYPLYATGDRGRPVGSIAVVPLIRSRAVLGAIVVEDEQAERMTQVEADTLALLASVASVALENVLRLENARERASRDSLTGLPNRGVFDEQLRQRLAESDRFGQPLSLVLLDVDHFKAVNDRYGHDAGDRVLVAVARAAERTIRNIDLCARYGGEELALLLPQTGLAAACEVAERVRQAIAAQEVALGERTLTVTASLGVNCYPEIAATHDELFPGADQALYDAKARGRNCVKHADISTDKKHI